MESVDSDLSADALGEIAPGETEAGEIVPEEIEAGEIVPDEIETEEIETEEIIDEEAEYGLTSEEEIVPESVGKKLTNVITDDADGAEAFAASTYTMSIDSSSNFVWRKNRSPYTAEQSDSIPVSEILGLPPTYLIENLAPGDRIVMQASMCGDGSEDADLEFRTAVIDGNVLHYMDAAGPIWSTDGSNKVFVLPTIDAFEVDEGTQYFNHYDMILHFSEVAVNDTIQYYCSDVLFVPKYGCTAIVDESSLKGEAGSPEESGVGEIFDDAYWLTTYGIEYGDLDDTDSYAFSGWTYAYHDGTQIVSGQFKRVKVESEYVEADDVYTNLILPEVFLAFDRIPARIIVSAQWTAFPGVENTVTVDQESLKGQPVPTSGIPTAFTKDDTQIRVTATVPDTDEYAFDGWQYRYSDEEEYIRHNVPIDDSGTYVITARRRDLTLYAKWRMKVTSAEILLNDQETDSISISNEIVSSKSLDSDFDIVKINVLPEPEGADETLMIIPDNTGFYGMGLTPEDAVKEIFQSDVMPLPYIEPAPEESEVRTFYIAAAKSGFDNTPINRWKEEGRRSGTSQFSVFNGSEEIGSFTVNIDGYDSEEEVYYEDGDIVKGTADTAAHRTVAGKDVSFDEDGLRVSALTVTPAYLFLPAGGAVATLTADGSEDDIDWMISGDVGDDEPIKVAAAGEKDREDDDACMNIVTGYGFGSVTFTAQEKNFPISSQEAVSKVSVFGLTGTIIDSEIPNFDVDDAVAPGQWKTSLAYSKGEDGTVNAESMLLYVRGGEDLFGTGITSLRSSNPDVVSVDGESDTVTAEGVGNAVVTLVYGSTMMANSNRPEVTLTLEISVFDSEHTEHDWVLERKDVTWKFDWSETVSDSDDIISPHAKAEFYCANGNETFVNEAGSLDFERTEELKEDATDGRIMFTATISDPDGKKNYSEKCWAEVHRTNIDDTFGSWEWDGVLHAGYPGPEVCDNGFRLEGLEKEYPYTAAAIKPVIKVIDNATGVTLANGTDYTVSYSKNKNIGTATVKVKGKGNYNKTNAEATFEIVDPKKGVSEDAVADLKGAKITAVYPKTFDYNGDPQYPESITLRLKNGSDITYHGCEGRNYADDEGNEIPAIVTFSGNVNKGTATVLLSGKNNTKGKATTVKKTFKINAINLSTASNEDLKVIVDEEVEWAAKGAQPRVQVFYKGRELLLGQDFKVSYKDNKKAGTTASVTVAGKGNYAKTKRGAASYSVVAFDLDSAEIIATTAAADVKGNKVKVTILDRAGNQIPAGKLVVTSKKGDADVGSAKLVAGDVVTVVATPKGRELTGECSKDVTVAANLAKAKIKVNLKKTYTGEPIELDEKDMENVAVTLKNATLTYGVDFEIVGYSNNVKKGSMTVIINGKGDKFSGSKSFKVKIEAKPLGQ
jgi:hypothetical protein